MINKVSRDVTSFKDGGTWLDQAVRVRESWRWGNTKVRGVEARKLAHRLSGWCQIATQGLLEITRYTSDSRETELTHYTLNIHVLIHWKTDTPWKRGNWDNKSDWWVQEKSIYTWGTKPARQEADKTSSLEPSCIQCSLEPFRPRVKGPNLCKTLQVQERKQACVSSPHET